MVALPRIIVKRWKDAGIDVLVNNAGMGRNDASLFDGNTASWVEMVSTNTLGVCMCTREAVQVRNLISLAWSILSHPRVCIARHHNFKLQEHCVFSEMCMLFMLVVR